MSKQAFQATYTLDARRDFAQRCRENHEGKVAVYVYVSPSHRKVIQLRNHKYVVSPAYSLAEFRIMLTRTLLVPVHASQSILVFLDKGGIPNMTSGIGELHAANHDADGILYLQLTGENTFGCDEFK